MKSEPAVRATGQRTREQLKKREREKGVGPYGSEGQEWPLGLVRGELGFEAGLK